MAHVLWSILGLVMIASTLAGVGWLVMRMVKRAEDPPKFIFKLVLTLLLTGGLLWYASTGVNLSIPFLCVLFGIVMSILWAPHLGALLAKPLTSMFDGGDTEADPEPLYSIAISRRKLGKYADAIAHIRGQLDRFPNDVTGQMMLAEIQAEDLNDLPGAQIVIQKLCQQKGHPPAAISAALIRLADWQLKYWQDVDSARESLEQIRTLYPDSEFANVAAQRIAHLGTRAAREASLDRTAIELPIGPEDVGLLKGHMGVPAPVEDPAARAEEYIRHLEQHPLDMEIREKLAFIYAEHYQRVDYAVNELEQIIQQPGQSTRQIVRALSLMADIHIKFGDDYESARAALQRIIDSYPNVAAAEAARNRLSHLKLEMRAKQQSRSVSMGTYDQDIGLKKKL